MMPSLRCRVSSDANGTLKPGYDPGMLPGGPYLSMAGGTLSGNLRLPDGDLYLRSGVGDINHGIGYYGSPKKWADQNIDGPVVYGCTGGALGTIRDGIHPQTIALTWDSSGSVQIKQNLDVYGDLRVKTIKVAMQNQASNVADYVFEPDYKLTALSEVEAYTKAHKHLPEVPSGTEIEKGGLDLAAMNLTLLKKVEELTLHAIEQQKLLESQTQANASQQRDIAELQATVKELKQR